jgi:hypothetical protein
VSRAGHHCQRGGRWNVEIGEPAFTYVIRGAHPGADAEERAMSEPRILMTGLMLGESPRWHDDRLWFSDWGAQEVIAVDLEGNHEVVTIVRSFPFSIDWLPDGRLLIVSASERRLLRTEPDGSRVTHATWPAFPKSPGTKSLSTAGAMPT